MNKRLVQRLLSLLAKKKWSWKDGVLLSVLVLLLVLGVVYGPSLGVVLSIGQKGGQTAHTIINSKSPVRGLNDEIIKGLNQNLSSLKDEDVTVVSAGGDWEADQLANEILEYMQKSGWKKLFRMRNLDPMKPGISFEHWGTWPAVQIGKNE